MSKQEFIFFLLRPQNMSKVLDAGKDKTPKWTVPQKKANLYDAKSFCTEYTEQVWSWAKLSFLGWCVIIQHDFAL